MPQARGRKRPPPRRRPQRRPLRPRRRRVNGRRRLLALLILSVLAAAYRLDGDERYAEAVATQLRSWWAANPFLSGIHWTSGIELGVRLLSWVWIRRLLDGWAGAGPLFEGNRAFLQQLHHHHEWLARLPSHGSSANNHILAEMAGQFAAGCAFPWFPESSSWREAAATKKQDAAKIGGGAAGGAVIGAILGGGSGAAKGAAVGGAGGTGVVLATRGKEVSVPAGTNLIVRLQTPITVRVRR